MLVINANPKPASFCLAMAEQYAATAGERTEVQLVLLSQLEFQLDLTQGYQQTQPLEADLQQFQQQLLWAEHLVLICPVWWGGMPAKLKGLLDRVLLPGFAFQYHTGSSIPEKLLRGRTSELMFTLDTPVFWYKWWQGAPLYLQLKRTILDFVGIRNTSVRYFGPLISADDNTRQRWLQQVRQQAARL
ncbi:MAG: NAD(P)H-dependent oxidoreductase [Rheinheimera sp.]|nr:NAD(P)H-dependent oxidoreductase [Rheinheimera sp.]